MSTPLLLQRAYSVSRGQYRYRCRCRQRGILVEVVVGFVVDDLSVQPVHDSQFACVLKKAASFLLLLLLLFGLFL